MTLAAAAAAATLLIGTPSTASGQAGQPVKNIVFVHGAFADGSSWSRVIPLLQAEGYNVTAVQNPLTSFADDLSATKRALAQQTGPVILVGHSWAGVVITEAGMDPKVAGLVYVAALAPDVGEAPSAIGKRYPPTPALSGAVTDKFGFMSLPTEVFVKHFASDLPAAEARVLAAVQAKESGLDAKPMQKLDALPDTNITMRLPLASNGRFSWRQVEKASKYAEDEKSHVYWIFARAYRSDGRQYWAMSRFSLDKNTTQPIFIEPGSFISTKAILRPDLSPDEQAK